MAPPGSLLWPSAVLIVFSLARVSGQQGMAKGKDIRHHMPQLLSFEWRIYLSRTIFSLDFHSASVCGICGNLCRDCHERVGQYSSCEQLSTLDRLRTESDQKNATKCVRRHCPLCFASSRKFELQQQTTKPCKDRFDSFNP